MTHPLHSFLDLTASGVRSQWEQIRSRTPPGEGRRQVAYLPIEILLCHALFQVIDPHRFGGGNIHLLPEPVRALAAIFCRSPGSLTNKMLNLDGMRANGGRLEPELFLYLHEHPEHFANLYALILRAAEDLGMAVPDVLAEQGVDAGELLGQEKFGHCEMAQALAETRAEQILLGEQGFSSRETERIALTRVRLGQHRFAARVLQNYMHRCGFCGFDAGALRRHRLLIASHIKPWRDATPAERLDARNGIAACALHDAAFDTGLLTVNGGLRIHRAARLSGVAADPGYLQTPTLRDCLLIPDGQPGPNEAYLRWHQQNCFLR